MYRSFIRGIKNTALKDIALQNFTLKNITLKNITMMQGLHWAARGIFKARGYQWEVRRNGEMQLGYWRKSLRSRNHRSPYPKRFVVMPGFGDTPLSWQIVTSLLYPVLKQNYDEIILFDFPGFGGFLSQERAFPSADMMMTTVADALDYLKPHTLLGHSLGGWLAGSYASLCGSGKRPTANRLNYSGPQVLLLANPSGIYPSEEVMKGCESIIKGSLSQGVSVIRPHLFAKEPFWFNRLVIPHFSRFLGREDIHQFVDSVKDHHTLDETAKDICAETWLIWGEKDTLVPVSCAEAWLKRMQKDETEGHVHSGVLLKDVGHSPHLEAPFATATIIAQIISGRVPHKLGKRWWNVVGAKSAIG